MVQRHRRHLIFELSIKLIDFDGLQFLQRACAELRFHVDAQEFLVSLERALPYAFLFAPWCAGG